MNFSGKDEQGKIYQFELIADQNGRGQPKDYQGPINRRYFGIDRKNQLLGLKFDTYDRFPQSTDKITPAIGFVLSLQSMFAKAAEPHNASTMGIVSMHMAEMKSEADFSTYLDKNLKNAESLDQLGVAHLLFAMAKFKLYTNKEDIMNATDDVKILTQLHQEFNILSQPNKDITLLVQENVREPSVIITGKDMPLAMEKLSIGSSTALPNHVQAILGDELLEWNKAFRKKEPHYKKLQETIDNTAKVLQLRARMR